MIGVRDVLAVASVDGGTGVPRDRVRPPECRLSRPFARRFGVADVFGAVDGSSCGFIDDVGGANGTFPTQLWNFGLNFDLGFRGQP
jgi:hypothetical protein